MQKTSKLRYLHTIVSDSDIVQLLNFLFTCLENINKLRLILKFKNKFILLFFTELCYILVVT